MIEVGEVPILIHIMRWYYSFGFNDFVICAGYRSWEIKHYFINYELRQNHLEIDHRKHLTLPITTIGRNLAQEKWRVRILDTGTECMTGGRVARALDLICSTDKFTDFALTYGDGLADVHLEKEYEFHKSQDLVGTVLGVRPQARFGELTVNKNNQVESFAEKPQLTQSFINGGFFFFKKEFRKFLNNEASCVLEREPLVNLAAAGQLLMFPHLGFWQPIDTLRDKNFIEKLIESGKAPWIPTPDLAKQC